LYIKYIHGVKYFLLLGHSGRGVKLTTDFHLSPRSIICGSKPPLPQYVFMAECLHKHRDNFTLNVCVSKRNEDVSWRKLHNDELHSLYSLLNIIRVIKSRWMRWVGHVARMGEGRGVYRVLVGRPEGKRPLGRPRRRWEDNIKMNLREIGIDGASWIRLAQDRVCWWAVVNTLMNLRVP
jgi:hypothetical protein